MSLCFLAAVTEVFDNISKSQFVSNNSGEKMEVILEKVDVVIIFFLSFSVCIHTAFYPLLCSILFQLYVYLPLLII